MRLAIIGSRQVKQNFNLETHINKYLNSDVIDTIISGGAQGIDFLACQYAKKLGVEFIELRPDYASYGRSATFIRNRSIVDNSDMVIAFWDGVSKGTKYTIDYANKRNISTIVITI